jgi:hypothetical protein
MSEKGEKLILQVYAQNNEKFSVTINSVRNKNM